MKELFKNKTQMKKHIKKVLNSWDENKNNPALIIWLVSEYKAKPVKYVWVQKDDYGNNQFSTDEGSFSYIKAVDFIYGKCETNKQRFTSAMRRHLVPYMRDIKVGMLKECATCLYTGIGLTVSNSHVDHVGDYEFSDIIKNYLHNIDLDSIEYIQTDNGDFVKDIQVFEKFKLYHDNLAVLEVVHSNWNLSRGKAK
tara:strand:+ start:160 stop:747 length:588 start_codon:yes stop_codon:yes gene_type:complete